MKIRDRPAHIASRLETGYWERDPVMGKRNKSAVLTLLERTSRILMAFTLASGNRSDRLRDRVIEALGQLPASLRRALTWDRGAEMAKNTDITAAWESTSTSATLRAPGNVVPTRTPTAK